MDVEAAARAWVEGWSQAWPAEDADAVARLYAEEAVYRSHPFRDAHQGPAGARAYARESFSSEKLLECRFGEPVSCGDRSAVEYWATMVSGGDEVTLAGCAVLRFAEDGRCVEHRDYWTMERGLRSPPPGWGE